MNERENKILNDDAAFESLLAEAMAKAGKERDEAMIAALAGMDEAEFRSILSDDSKEKGKGKTLFFNSVFFRVAAACVVAFALILGVGYFDIGSTDSSASATLFNRYYKGDKVNWSTFDAGDDKVNYAGEPSTAAIIEQATKLIASKSARSNRKGIDSLEHLLTLNYKKSLEHEIRWYLALGYLKDGRTKRAKEEFEKVKGMKSSHAKEAGEILKEMR